MRHLILKSLLSLAIAAPAVTLAPRMASAQDVEFRLGRDGPEVEVYDDRYDRDRRDRREEYREARRSGCSAERALDKAERMGLRRVRVADMDRRTIEVQGRKRNGERVFVTFSRDRRSCPVL